MDADWRRAFGRTLGLPRAERAKAKAQRNYLVARLTAEVNPTMRSCVEETRKALAFWTHMVSEMRAA
jgi:hypothetical protein